MSREVQIVGYADLSETRAAQEQVVGFSDYSETQTGGDVSTSVTGVSTSLQIGTVTVQAQGGVDVSVNVTGIASKAQLGSVTVQAQQQVAINASGVSTAAKLGNVTESTEQRVSISGVSSKMLEGAVSVQTQGLALDQYGFRWRNDDGNETTATWVDAQNADVSFQIDTPLRLRVGVDVQSADAPFSNPYRLMARQNGGGWFEVTYGAPAPVALFDSPNLADGVATSGQLIAPAGKVSGDFEAGVFADTTSGAHNVALDPAKYTELEFCIEMLSEHGASNDDVFDFKLQRRAA